MAKRKQTSQQPINLDIESSEKLGLFLQQQYQQLEQIRQNIAAIIATLQKRDQEKEKKG
jgi:dsDNA-binding SOS-regulon protein